MRPATVALNISRAREGVREAIDVHGPHGDQLNPAEATKLARDLVTAAAILDQLCPPAEVNNKSGRPRGTAAEHADPQNPNRAVT